MKSNKRTMGIILAALSLSLVAAGCSGNSTQVSSSSNSSGSSNSGGGDKIKLSLLHYYSEYPEAMAKLPKIYNAEHSNIELTQTMSDNYTQVLGSRIASGDTPEIFATATFTEACHYADASVDLTNEPYWDKLDKASYSAVTCNGKRVAIPLQTQAFGFIYNTDVFAKAGITAVPQTLDELKDAVQKLKDHGYIPFATSFKTDWTISQMMTFPFSMNANFKSVMDDIVQKKATFKGQDFAQKIVDLTTIIKENTEDKPSNVDFAGAAAMIANGQAGMYMEGDWTEPVIKKANPNAHIAFFPIPYSNNPEDARMFDQAAITLHVGKSKHVKEAKEFINWIVTSQSAKDWLSKDLEVTSPITGVMPDKGDLLISSAKIEKASPSKISVWGQDFIPTDLLTNMGSINSKYAMGAITGEQWIDQISKLFESYKPKK